MTRAVKISALLSSLDPITDGELESIAQKAIDETYLDVVECEIEVVDLEETP